MLVVAVLNVLMVFSLPALLVKSKVLGFMFVDIVSVFLLVDSLAHKLRIFFTTNLIP